MPRALTHDAPYLTLLQAKCAKVKAIAAQVAKREAAKEN